LLVDDNELVREAMAEQLVAQGHRVSVAMDGETMRQFLDTHDPVDLIVLDALMPGDSSATLALHARDRAIKLVMISGSLDKIKEFQDKADQLLSKPFRFEDLGRAIELAMANGTFGQRGKDPK
jgi:DNA-binding response OmpR family regulator